MGCRFSASDAGERRKAFGETAILENPGLWKKTISDTTLGARGRAENIFVPITNARSKPSGSSTNCGSAFLNRTASSRSPIFGSLATFPLAHTSASFALIMTVWRNASGIAGGEKKLQRFSEGSQNCNPSCTMHSHICALRDCSIPTASWSR